MDTSEISTGIDRAIFDDLPTETLNLTWTIRRFGVLNALAKSSTTLTQNIFARFSFDAGLTFGTPCKMQFYIAQSSEEKMSIYLQLLRSTKNQPVYAKYSIYFKKISRWNATAEMGIRCYKNPALLVGNEKGSGWGYSAFHSVSELANGGYLDVESDELTLKFRVVVYKVNFQEHSNAQVGQRKSNWSQLFGEKLGMDFGNLLESGVCSDVTLAITQSDGMSVRIPAHKCILSGRSPVLAAMFSNEMKESSTGEVVIEDISPAAMKMLLKFIYSGTVDENWGSVAPELIHSADKYELKDLTKFIDENVESACTPENVMRIMQLASLHKLNLALQTTKKYVKDNIDGVLDSVASIVDD